MAEGPQVHRIAERLRRALLGRALVEVRLQPARLRPLEPQVSGSTVTEVEARGKHLLIFLHTGSVLHSHLMMWGRWEVLRPGQASRKDTGRLWALLGTGRWNAVLFNGPVPEILAAESLPVHPVLGTLRPDPVRPDYRREEVLCRLHDPARLAGVGEHLQERGPLASAPAPPALRPQPAVRRTRPPGPHRGAGAADRVPTAVRVRDPAPSALDGGGPLRRVPQGGSALPAVRVAGPPPGHGPGHLLLPQLPVPRGMSSHTTREASPRRPLLC